MYTCTPHRVYIQFLYVHMYTALCVHTVLYVHMYTILHNTNHNMQLYSLLFISKESSENIHLNCSQHLILQSVSTPKDKSNLTPTQSISFFSTKLPNQTRNHLKGNKFQDQRKPNQHECLLSQLFTRLSDLSLYWFLCNSSLTTFTKQKSTQKDK